MLGKELSKEPVSSADAEGGACAIGVDVADTEGVDVDDERDSAVSGLGGESRADDVTASDADADADADGGEGADD
jgi:hypothetical protein